MSKTTKAPAKTTKAADIDDLLGEGTKPAAKATKPAAKAAKAAPEPQAEAKPAKGASKAAKAPAAEPAKATKPAAKAAAEPKAARVREPIVFEEGEKEKLMKAVAKAVAKGEQNSRDLAVKLEIKTRKLRQVLYSMQRAGTVTLELGGARAQGITVSAA